MLQFGKKYSLSSTMPQDTIPNYDQQIETGIKHYNAMQKLVHQWRQREFAYRINPNNHIQITLCLSMQGLRKIWSFKFPMMDYLSQEKLWFAQHKAPMHSAQTIIAGWFRCQHHPDVCHFPTLQDNINLEILSYFDTNKEDLLKWAGNQAALRNWDGVNVPVISII